MGRVHSFAEIEVMLHKELRSKREEFRVQYERMKDKTGKFQFDPSIFTTPIMGLNHLVMTTRESYDDDFLYLYDEVRRGDTQGEHRLRVKDLQLRKMFTDDTSRYLRTYQQSHSQLFNEEVFKRAFTRISTDLKVGLHEIGCAMKSYDPIKSAASSNATETAIREVKRKIGELLNEGLENVLADTSLIQRTGKEVNETMSQVQADLKNIAGGLLDQDIIDAYLKAVSPGLRELVVKSTVKSVLSEVEVPAVFIDAATKYTVRLSDKQRSDFLGAISSFKRAARYRLSPELWNHDVSIVALFDQGYLDTYSIGRLKNPWPTIEQLAKRANRKNTR